MNDARFRDAAKGKVVRRRRSWYRRRLRIQRAAVAALVGVMIVGACWLNAARLFSRSSQSVFQTSSETFWGRGNIHKNLAFAAANSAKPGKALSRVPGVYPYSVVPGGIKDAASLREAAARDYVVRRHYARFEYQKARLERLKEAREVYLSYRIRNNVFWTRKKVRLQPGELLLTDGKIAARARCGNQISDVAKPEVSDEEPAEDVLDQPIVAALEPPPSLPFNPSLAPPDLPIGQPGAPPFFGGGFIFPYVPVGVPIGSGKCPAGDELVHGICHHKHKHGGGSAPEPSTMVLLGSGLALIAWRYRKISRPTSS